MMCVSDISCSSIQTFLRDFIPAIYWGGKVRPGPHWAADLPFKFTLPPVIPLGQATAHALRSTDFLIFYFYFKLLCALLACADTFQAAELCGSQQLCCPELKGRSHKIWPKFCCSESHATPRDLCSLAGLLTSLTLSCREI